MSGRSRKSTKLGEGDFIGTVSKHRKKINVKNIHSKENNKLKVTTELDTDMRDEIGDDENIVVGAEVLREKGY